MTKHRRKLNLWGPGLSAQTPRSAQSCRSSPPSPAEAKDLVDLLPVLRAFARSLCGSLDQADDLVRETLFRGLADIQTLQESRMKPWVFAIMRRIHLARLEAAAWRHESSSSCLSEIFSTDAREGTLCGREIARAMDRLPAPERQAAVLVCMIGLSHEDAADVCDCDAATINVRVHDARKRLSAVLANRAGVKSDKPMADKVE